MTIHAYTEQHNDYPAFVNLSEKPDGIITLTVRSRGNGGQTVATIDLSGSQLLALVRDAGNFLGDKAASSAEFAETINFEDFIQYGRDNGANIVNGMPWSFQYKGRAVSHENDERYLISVPNSAVSLNFTPGDLLVAHADGSLSVTPGVARA